MSATMMNHSRRQILAPGPSSSSNKRKERDGLFDGFKPSPLTTKNLAKPSIHRAPPAPVKSPKPAAAPNNKLLAGYLAHEFLTKGTLFGEPFDPAKAEVVPVSATPSRGKPAHCEKRKAEGGEDDKRPSEKEQRYLEVADLLRADGVHIPGIVNPTQLARFLQLG